MSSFRGKRESLAFGLACVLSACAHRTATAPSPPAAKSEVTPPSVETATSAKTSPSPATAIPTELSLEALERLEFERPQDPALKLQLARKLWCLKRRGQAFEHWLWLRQSAPETPEGREAAQRLESARSSPADLAEELGCK